MNFQKLFPSNSFENLVDKLNKNFDEILLNGGGPMGPIGPIGLTGSPGGFGPIGLTGSPGADGKTWTISSIDPVYPPSPLNKIYWFNYSNSTFFEWNGTSWNNIGTIGVSNYFSLSGNVIKTNNNNYSLVLSNESGTGTNALSYTLKLNNPGGNHLIFTSSDSGDNTGTQLKLSSTQFEILQNNSSKKLKLTSQGTTDIQSVSDLSFIISNFNFHVLSKLGISDSGTRFTPTETLQIGNPNGTDIATFSIEKNSSIKIKGTNSGNHTEIKKINSDNGGILYWPSESGVISSNRDFNIQSNSSEYIKLNIDQRYGWTQTGYGSLWSPIYTFGNIMSNSSNIILRKLPINTNSTLFLNSSSNPNIGMYFSGEFKWKILGNQVHLIWDLNLQSFNKGLSSIKERIMGIEIDLPYNTINNVSIKARSPKKIFTSAPQFISGYDSWNYSIHNANLHLSSFYNTTNYAFKSSKASYQILDERDTSNLTSMPFLKSKMYIMIDELIDYGKTNIKLNGECFLEIADDILTAQNWSISDTIKKYFDITSTQFKGYKYSDGLPIGSMIFWTPNNNDVHQVFTTTGLGIRSDLIGWAICDGRNGTNDLRGCIPIGASKFSIDSSSNVVPNPIRSESTYVENGSLPGGFTPSAASDDHLSNQYKVIKDDIHNNTTYNGTYTGNMHLFTGVWIQKIIF